MMRRPEAEHSRLINISDVEDHQEEEEEEGEGSKLIKINENKVVRINISGEGMTL